MIGKHWLVAGALVLAAAVAPHATSAASLTPQSTLRMTEAEGSLVQKTQYSIAVAGAMSALTVGAGARAATSAASPVTVADAQRTQVCQAGPRRGPAFAFVGSPSARIERVGE